MTEELRHDIANDEKQLQSRNRLTSFKKKGAKLKKGKDNSADEDSHSENSDDDQMSRKGDKRQD